MCFTCSKNSPVKYFFGRISKTVTGHGGMNLFILHCVTNLLLYANIPEAVQCFACQHNTLLPSFTYLDPACFIG